MKRMGILLSIGLAVAPALWAQTGYTFAKLADNSGPLADFDPFAMAINSGGAVAVHVFLDDNSEAIVRFDGQVMTTIATDTSGLVSLGGPVDIADNGTVAFMGGQLIMQTAFTGVFAGSGGALTTIGPVPPEPSTDPCYTLFSFSAAGVAAMGSGACGQGPGALVTGSGGPITTVYDGDDLPTEDLPTGGNFLGGYMSDNGTLGIIAGAARFRDFVYKGSSASAALVRIAIKSEPPLSNTDIRAVVVNDGGKVAFINGVFGLEMTIFAGTSEASLAAVVATSAGPFAGFNVAGGAALNASDKLAFWAFLDPPDLREGIFRGPDPVADEVIIEGDVLDGSTVTSLMTNRFSLNGSGQIVFTAGLADGTTGLYLAEPNMSGCRAANGVDFTLADDTILTPKIYEACNSITVGPNLMVMGFAGRLSLLAGNTVILGNGTSVGVDGSLTVTIAPGLIP